jgi:hypothetical protein
MVLTWLNTRVRFSREEFSGAFGDIGTDLPLIIGILQASSLDPTSALAAFGLLQIFTGLAYGIPMPVQPLKAMAVIVISQKLPAHVLLGGGLAVGIIMLVLTLSGALSWLASMIPVAVIRGVQLGLGLQLGKLALGDYVMRDGQVGYLVAAVATLAVIKFRENRRVPIAAILILVGMIWSLAEGRVLGAQFRQAFGFNLPKIHVPTLTDFLTGFFVLAIPQIPLSLSNSVFATERLANDLFPQAKVTVKKIGLTYGFMNLANPFLGGIPTCHGCGGLAGMHFFGARTGGAPVIYGLFCLFLGMFFGGGVDVAVKLFPFSILGVILMFESVALMRQIADVTQKRRDFTITLLCGLAAASLPNGYVVALLGGLLIDRLLPRLKEA